MVNAAQNLEFFNGFGGFSENGREYAIIMDGDNVPPAPWINVIANKDFGFMISETGAGSTWAFNSRENKLTPWSNDPVIDQCPETIYIKDETTGRIMTPVSLGRKDRGAYLARHGFGYSCFEHEEDGIRQHLTVFVPVDQPVKLWKLTLINDSDRERSFTLTYYVEWVLGVDRASAAPYVVTSYDNEYEYLCARNVYNYDFRGFRAFMFSSGMITSYTGDRQEVLGPGGSVREPGGLGEKFSCRTGEGYDPCGAIQVPVSIGPGGSVTVIFGLGCSNSEEEIGRMRTRYRDVGAADAELERVKQYWDDLLGAVKVETTDRAMDILVNGWLLYQAVSCRLFARAAFYQCGGAYGFRDQLQDAMALVWTKPEMLKEQILLASSRQFEEGDVQHWWHPPKGVGVRTRISDDLLWLPYATAHYIESTGDWSILSERTPYIKGPALEDGVGEMMFLPEVSEKDASIYEHCRNAIKRVRYGEHGLPLMGGGDWNDGMNRAGIQGKGESIWLGWFMCDLLRKFIPVCRHENDHGFADELGERLEMLKRSIEEHAWDGEWYLRAFYDDGSKMGSKENEECRIDSISQSWSIISGAADPERARMAFSSAWKHLVVEKEGISLLLTPAFDKTDREPGYIRNYYPGMRENGGQYTHAAVWLAIAASILGDSGRAYRLFRMLNPIYATITEKDALRYEREPYVMTADVLYNDYCMGRGGWSWYTGSAGWMYSGLVRWFLGLEKRGSRLHIRPRVPEGFGDYRITYRYGTSLYIIDVKQGHDADADGVAGNTADGMAAATTEGTAYGMADSTLVGMSMSASEGAVNGAVKGAAGSAAECAPESITGGSARCAAGSRVNGTAEDMAESAEKGTAEGTTDHKNVTEGITEYKGMAEETTEYEETVIDLVDDGTVHSIKVRLVHSAIRQYKLK